MVHSNKYSWQKNKSPDSYGKNEIWRKISEYYKYYYEKYSKQ